MFEFALHDTPALFLSNKCKNFSYKWQMSELENSISENSFIRCEIHKNRPAIKFIFIANKLRRGNSKFISNMTQMQSWTKRKSHLNWMPSTEIGLQNFLTAWRTLALRSFSRSGSHKLLRINGFNCCWNAWHALNSTALVDVLVVYHLRYRTATVCKMCQND